MGNVFGQNEIMETPTPLSGGDSSDSDGTLNWNDIQKEITSNHPSIRDEHLSDHEGGSSPFISEALYNKIMDGGNITEDNTSSPFISEDDFKKIMKGGDVFDDLDTEMSKEEDELNEIDEDEEEEEETSDDLLIKELNEITLTSDELSEHKHKHHKKFNPHKNHQQKYNFSETSSEFQKKNYVGGDSSDDLHRVESDSINTSDINIVSVDSVNGRRYI